MVIQSMLIWIVLDGELPVAPSEKFKNSMGWTVWNVDLRKNKNTQGRFLGKLLVCYKFFFFCQDFLLVFVQCSFPYVTETVFVHRVMSLYSCTYWSSISSSWLKTSGPRISVPCELGLWDMEARKDPSVHERHAAGSRNLLKNNVHIKYRLVQKINPNYYLIGLY